MPAAAQPSDEVQALLDAAVDGVVLVDHLGCIQSFSRSAEQLFGYRAQEVLGCNVGVLMTDQDRSAHDGFLARYVSTRVPHIIGTGREVSARRKDGSVFRSEEHTSELQSQSNLVCRLLLEKKKNINTD